MTRNRKNEIPTGLNYLMWLAFARAPWLLFQRLENSGLSGRDRHGAQRKPYRY
jgi:hypothetical protein